MGGKTDLETAEVLLIDGGEARRYFRNICEKIGAANRVEAPACIPTLPSA